MSKFEEFIKENNYEGDLEYQLCDLELAFDEGMRIGKSQNRWQPSGEQMEYLAKAITTLGDEGDCKTALILNDLRFELKKLKEE